MTELGDALAKSRADGEAAAAAADGGVVEEERNCLTCERDDTLTPATCKCGDCDTFYCEKDGVAHAERKKHKIHPLRAAAAVDPSAVRLQPTNCDTHGFPLDMFCLNCKVALCAKCALAGHQGHSLKDLDDVTSVMDAETRTVIKSARESAELKNAAAASAASARLQLAASHASLIESVNMQEAAVHQLVSTHFRRLRATIDNEKNERDKVLESREHENAVSADQTLAVAMLCERALAAGNNLALASALHTVDLMEPMLHKLPDSLPVATDMDMVFDLAPLTAALANLGNFIPFPINAEASVVTSATMPAEVDVAVAAAGDGRAGAGRLRRLHHLQRRAAVDLQPAQPGSPLSARGAHGDRRE